MPEPQDPDANARFDQLWEEIGAKRVTIGDEEKGVEIIVDADLSIFGILDKLKAAAASGRQEGEISDDEEKKIKQTLDDTTRTLSGGLHDRLRHQIEKLTGKGR